MSDKRENPLHNARLDEILNSILKPLSFASKDGFVHMNSIKGVGPLVERLCTDAASLRLPGDIERAFMEIKALFSGFDSLSTDVKKERIRAAGGIIKSISARPDEAPPTPEEVKKRLKALSTPLEYVKGIGPRLAERLKKKGLSTVEDLLYFLPVRYEDRSSIKKIKELAPGLNVTVMAQVLASGEVRYGRRKVFEMAVGDGTGILKLKWFNYRVSGMRERFKPGQKVFLYGTVSAFGNQMEIIHPDIEFVDEGEGDEGWADLKGITPVYSQIENFHQKTVRKIVKNAVDSYACSALGAVPDAMLAGLGLLDLSTAFKEAHGPASGGGYAIAKKSLVFDELFTLELGLLLKRNLLKKERGITFSMPGPAGRLEEKLREKLPFRLTNAQEQVLSDIRKDMAAPHPMNRLIQGDVGSGKTIVSLIAALLAIEAGYQAAIMAPTEILSEQHFLTVHGYAEDLGISVLLLTGNAPKARRKEALERIREGRAGLIVGTHALIQKDVEFKKLGLIIIDEQHRFGVVQRGALKKKGFGAEDGVSPDMLIMTATPIPRTLSMTVFGDLDVSVIDELPPGRVPVRTRILREKDRATAYGMIKKEVEAGRQCYIVYPLVEESEEMDLKDATNMKEHLQKDIFSRFRVGLLHGRMKSDEKERVMREFKGGGMDILVSTTVIEVGVDVPNATIILIEHAERFGLAQLHQLRGRVGRGDKSSTCLLLAAWTNSEDTFRRLKVMEGTMDGFKIAEEDLKIRGPGDFIGTRQAGLPDFRTSGALTDLSILKKAREGAFRYLEKNPGLSGDDGALIKALLKARWEGRLELAEIG